MLIIYIVFISKLNDERYFMWYCSAETCSEHEKLLEVFIKDCCV
jgi:hypothetical protein